MSMASMAQEITLQLIVGWPRTGLYEPRNWRVDTCSDLDTLLGKRNWSLRSRDFSSRAETANRVGSVSSNCTGHCVFLWITMARLSTWFPWVMSRNRNLTRSHPRSLLSMARLNMAEVPPDLVPRAF